MTDVPGLTPRQQKWFASVRANLELATGKPLSEWLEIVKSCPETAPRARAQWLKTHHGVGQNHAAFILDSSRPATGPGWEEPAALRAALWKDAGSLAILEAVERVANEMDGLTIGQRKGYTAFSRDVQFAAMRPLKGGRALLGLKLEPQVSERLAVPVRKESWSERLVSVVELDDVAGVDSELAGLFEAAGANG